jgi:biopolymer transport protein ExbD
MADLETGGGGGHGKHQKRRAKKSSTRIDMTPMVDLAFLLLTFFVLTSTFSKPSTMEITMPIDDKTVKPLDVKHIVTIVLDKSDTVYYYYSLIDTASATPFKVTDYSPKGIRKVLFDYNKSTIDSVEAERKKIFADKSLNEEQQTQKFKNRRSELVGHRNALTVVIKTYDDAKYGRVVDMVDEMNVVQVGKYALVDMAITEKALLQKQFKK